MGNTTSPEKEIIRELISLFFQLIQRRSGKWPFYPSNRDVKTDYAGKGRPPVLYDSNGKLAVHPNTISAFVIESGATIFATIGQRRKLERSRLGGLRDHVFRINVICKELDDCSSNEAVEMIAQLMNAGIDCLGSLEPFVRASLKLDWNNGPLVSTYPDAAVNKFNELYYQFLKNLNPNSSPLQVARLSRLRGRPANEAIELRNRAAFEAITKRGGIDKDNIWEIAKDIDKAFERKNISLEKDIWLFKKCKKAKTNHCSYSALAKKADYSKELIRFLSKKRSEVQLQQQL